MMINTMVTISMVTDAVMTISMVTNNMSESNVSVYESMSLVSKKSKSSQLSCHDCSVSCHEIEVAIVVSDLQSFG